MEQDHGHHGHNQMDHGANHANHQQTTPAEALRVGWELNPKDIQPRQETEIKLSLKDSHGIPATAFSVVHEKQMHLLAISKDLSTFLHLHPEYIGDGEFTVKTKFPSAGSYKLFADFMPEGGTQQLATFEHNAEGAENTQTVTPDEVLKKTVNGLDFKLSFDRLAANQHLTMAFTITDAEPQVPVKELEPYLGSAGHVVIVSSDLEKFLHVHPTDEKTTGPTVTYMTTFPEPGIYKIWGQFKHKEEMHTVPFVVEVPSE
ncbi:hypothetical protein [Mesobacillus subterraneus]|uniref:hypothetical protein n=1 Tax=Mesobacillus subterraneus TaxID=285983 RepID=UPI00069C3DC0|nr:hypothetical protein [Mesobacillus subterraneus]